MKLSVKVPMYGTYDDSPNWREGFRAGVLAAEEALEWKVEWSIPPSTPTPLSIEETVRCTIAQSGAEFKIASPEFPIDAKKQEYIENALKRTVLLTLFGLR